MEAIYFMEEPNGNLRRIDSRMIEPMHKAGYPIVKMWLDGQMTEVRLEPNEEIPSDYIQDSEYGFVIFK